jgi:hypothetical protein
VTSKTLEEAIHQDVEIFVGLGVLDSEVVDLRDTAVAKDAIPTDLCCEPSTVVWSVYLVQLRHGPDR